MAKVDLQVPVSISFCVCSVFNHIVANPKHDMIIGAITGAESALICFAKDFIVIASEVLLILLTPAYFTS